MTMKRLAVYGMLSSLALLLVMAVPTYSQMGDTTVIILESVGGTTDPGPGTHVFTSGEVWLYAMPDPGYKFVAWYYLGPNNFDVHLPTAYSSPVISFDCAAGNTVEFQAIFAPM